MKASSILSIFLFVAVAIGIFAFIIGSDNLFNISILSTIFLGALSIAKDIQEDRFENEVKEKKE